MTSSSWDLIILFCAYNGHQHKKDRVVTDTGVKSLGMDQGDPVFLGVPEGSEISMSEDMAPYTASIILK